MALESDYLASDEKFLPLLETEWQVMCRTEFLPWCIEALDPFGLEPARHHRLIIAELEKVIRGECTRLMLFAPPGSAKSTYVNHLLVPHLFARLGAVHILGVSNTARLAERFSRRIHTYIRENEATLGYRLRTEAGGEWSVTNGGSYVAAGAGGVIVGTRADFVIMDDPISGREEADSELRRERVWDWYTGDLERRKNPDTPIILMHTRWHEDDLAGRLLSVEADKWRVISIPAECESLDDPLGRSVGEFLWEDDPKEFGYARALREDKETLFARGATREWASQFQQRPRPAEGSLFRIGRIEILDVCPPLVVRGRGWDVAATKTMGSRDPDWTCGVGMGRTPEGTYVIYDVRRQRGGPDDTRSLVLNTARLDGGNVRIGFPQDPGQAGKAQVLDYVRMLSGFTVDSLPVTGDKGTRASPLASQANGSNVAIVRGEWNKWFLDELAAFPSGAHDDGVDAAAEAFRLVGLGPVPIVFSPAQLTALRSRGMRR